MNSRIEKSAANAIASIINNLTFVVIDHDKAIASWVHHCEGIQMMRDKREHMAAYFYADNFAILLRQKLVMGIIAHRKQGNFHRYKLRERVRLNQITRRREARESQTLDGVYMS